MSSIAESLGALARGVGQLLRFPTAFLLLWAGVVLAVLGLQVWVLLAGGVSTTAMVVVLALLALLVLPVVLLAVRRHRWIRLTEQTQTGPTVVVGHDVVTIDSLSDRVEDEMSGIDGEEDVRAVMDAFTEVQLPEPNRRGAGARLTRIVGFGRLALIGRVFGRIERAQRALLTAAGGRVNAPYLADDLRITVAAFAGTVLTIVVGGLGIVVLAVVLLLR